MSSFGHIYRITNTINDKSYIGATTQENPNHRWVQHKHSASNGAVNCRYLYSAMRKYGIDNFVFEVMAVADTKKQLNLMENAFISLFSTHYTDGGYNISRGGLVSKHTDETKEKMSSAYYKGQYHKERRPVDKYNLKGKLIDTFESIEHAYKDLGIRSGSIGKCCRGDAYTVHGYVYRYKGDDFNKFPIKGNSKKEIDKYNLDGELIEKYKSATEAAEDNGSTIGNVITCCKGDIKTSKGFVYRYHNEPFNKFTTTSSAKNSVLQIDPVTDKVVKKFSSVLEAARAHGGNRNTHIYEVRGTNKTAYGYKWRSA